MHRGCRKTAVNDPVLVPGERLDDLACGGRRIIQRTDEFCFSMDAVLLAQQRMGAPERIAQEGELTLALVQETQVLVPDEDAAVNRHA